jgi:hypothetical protein
MQDDEIFSAACIFNMFTYGFISEDLIGIKYLSDKSQIENIVVQLCLRMLPNKGSKNRHLSAGSASVSCAGVTGSQFASKGDSMRAYDICAENYLREQPDSKMRALYLGCINGVSTAIRSSFRGQYGANEDSEFDVSEGSVAMGLLRGAHVSEILDGRIVSEHGAAAICAHLVSDLSAFGICAGALWAFTAMSPLQGACLTDIAFLASGAG